MGLYEFVSRNDLIEPVADEIARGILRYDDDGKLRMRHINKQLPDNFWSHAAVDTERRCTVWLKYYFLRYGIISRNCFNCWKTVCRPKTITQLFAIEELQKEIYEKHGYPGKCGLETRGYGKYKGPYASFWYNPLEGGLVEARRRTRVIERLIHEEIGPDIPVILKRACTEMEEKAGPSNHWVYPEDQHEYEDKLDDFFGLITYEAVPQELMKIHRHKKWLEHGFENQDPDVANYVDHFPESFGITKTIDYYHDEPKMAGGIVKGGQLGSTSEV